MKKSHSLIRALGVSALVLATVSGCALAEKNTAQDPLPAGSVVLEADNPRYAEAVVDKAVMKPGDGGVSRAVVIELTQDTPVYRLWNGPNQDPKVNYRKGSWWTFTKPTGPAEKYRADNEICPQWNALTYVASCTLKAGTVVATGPGQSVNCPPPGPSYDANPDAWQVYVNNAWKRPGLACPDESADYRADPNDLSKPLN